MKKIILVSGLLIATATALVSFKKSPSGTDTQTPKVDPFEAVEIECAMDAEVILQDGATPGITLTGDPEQLEHLKVRVSGKKLYVTYEGSYRTRGRYHSELRATINMPVLTNVEVTGSAIINVRGNANNNTMRTRVSGSGMIMFDNVNARDFWADQSGSGSIGANAGKIDNAHLVNSGSGSVHMLDVNITDATADNTGSGGISLSASHRLNASETGSGSIRFRGHPEDFSQDVTGSGSIKRIN